MPGKKNQDSISQIKNDGEFLLYIVVSYSFNFIVDSKPIAAIL